MSDKVAEIKSILSQSNDAAWISSMWDTFNIQRQCKWQNGRS